MIKLKNLLLEGKKEDLAIDFLRSTIAGTPFENRTFIVGGAVRDEKLGKPIKDIDLVVGLPKAGNVSNSIDYDAINDKDSSAKFSNFITSKINVGRNENEKVFPKIVSEFGTAGFRLKGVFYKGEDLSDIDIEVVSPRGETYTENSRNPEVREGSFRDDAERRDLTINSLFKNITTGEILDLTGKGNRDFENKILRTPLDPDITFSDDPLRMMRLIRFYSRMKNEGWSIDPASKNALKSNADRLKIIVKERIKTELDKIFESPNANAGIYELIQSGLIKMVFPNVSITKEKLKMLKEAKNALLRKIVMFYDVDNFKNIMSELKFTGDEIKSVDETRKYVNFFDTGEENSKILKFRRVTGKMSNIILDFIDLLNKPVNVNSIKTKIEQMKDIPLKPPISGNDLIALGIAPGPKFKEVLDTAQAEFEEDPTISKGELMLKIKAKIKK